MWGGVVGRQIEVGGAYYRPSTLGRATMDADLDLLLIAVYCMADDFLPARPGNARRRISDAELITLCVAQAMMGMPCDERFLRAARRQLGHLFPYLPERTAFISAGCACRGRWKD